MNCPRPHCGGLLVEECQHEGSALKRVWKCSACARWWPITALSEEETPGMSRLRNHMADQGLDFGPHGQCKGTQGRGRCKKPAGPDGKCPRHRPKVYGKPAAKPKSGYSETCTMMKAMIAEHDDQIRTLTMKRNVLQDALAILAGA